jgi:hypothetical protein
MKKSTKKIVMSLFIILIFGLSSIAYVATSFFGPKENTQQNSVQSYFIDGNIDIQTENTYVQNGYTWIKFYSNGNDNEFLAFVKNLPNTYTIPSGQHQIIVQKMSTQVDETYILIESLQGQERVGPEANSTVDALCKLLTIPPVECALKSINTTQ